MAGDGILRRRFSGLPGEVNIVRDGRQAVASAVHYEMPRAKSLRTPASAMMGALAEWLDMIGPISSNGEAIWRNEPPASAAATDEVRPKPRCGYAHPCVRIAAMKY